MIAHLEAIRSRIAVPSIPAGGVHLWSVDPSTPAPFVILSTAADASGDLRLSGVRDRSFEEDVRVKVVALTPEAVSIILTQIKEQIVGLLTVPGWDARVRWVRSEFIDLDDTTINPTTGRADAIGVDTFALISRPEV